jgi:hypothetical protein
MGFIGQWWKLDSWVFGRSLIAGFYNPVVETRFMGFVGQQYKLDSSDLQAFGVPS